MVGVGAGRVRILEWGVVEVDRVQRLHLLVWSSAKPKAASGRVGGRGVQTVERRALELCRVDNSCRNALWRWQKETMTVLTNTSGSPFYFPAFLLFGHLAISYLGILLLIES